MSDPKNLFDLVMDTEVKETPAEREASVHLDGRAFAAEVIGSVEYRESIKRRLMADDLSPQVELFLLHTFYGKPTERREIVFPDGIPDLSKLSDEELAAKIAESTHKLRQAQSAETLMSGPSPSKSVM